MPTNEEVLKYRADKTLQKRKTKLLRERQQLYKKLDALTNQISYLDARLHAASEVDEVFEGIAIQCRNC